MPSNLRGRSESYFHECTFDVLTESTATQTRTAGQRFTWQAIYGSSCPQRATRAVLKWSYRWRIGPQRRFDQWFAFCLPKSFVHQKLIGKSQQCMARMPRHIPEKQSLVPWGRNWLQTVPRLFTIGGATNTNGPKPECWSQVSTTVDMQGTGSWFQAQGIQLFQDDNKLAYQQNKSQYTETIMREVPLLWTNTWVW
jgi:hypothetical protein